MLGVGWVVMRRIREPSRLFRPVRAFKDVMSGRGGEGENSLPGLSGLLGLQGLFKLGREKGAVEGHREARDSLRRFSEQSRLLGGGEV